MKICVENTHNYWGGAVVDIENLREIWKIVEKYGLKVHLDGARIFNASVYSGIPVREYARYAHSVMFSLSKGLSAPIGIALTEMVDRLKEDHRKARIFAEGLGKVQGYDTDIWVRG